MFLLKPLSFLTGPTRKNAAFLRKVLEVELERHHDFDAISHLCFTVLSLKAGIF